MKRIALFAFALLFTSFGFAQDFVNDVQIRQKLEQQMQAVIGAGEVTPVDELMLGLSRSRGDFTVASPFELVGAGDDLYEKVKKATLVVASYALCGNCSKHHSSPASGFMISSDGLAVTNYHVMEKKDASAFAVMTSDGKIHKVLEIVAANKIADVAVIRIEGEGFDFLPVAQSASPGEDVYVLSHPNGAFYYMTRGVVARYTRNGQKPILEITADYAAGSSGGPVVNSKGQVVGVVAATSSIYYHTIRAGQTRGDLQMVRKFCVPSGEILGLQKSRERGKG